MWKKFICILLLFSMSFMVMGENKIDQAKENDELFKSSENYKKNSGQAGKLIDEIEEDMEKIKKIKEENQKFFDDGSGNTGKYINCTYNNFDFGQDDTRTNSVFLQCEYNAGNVTCKAYDSTDKSGEEFTIKNLNKLNESILKNNKGKSGAKWCPEAVFKKGNTDVAFGTLSSGKKNLEACCADNGEEVKSGSYCGAETRTNYVAPNKSTTVRSTTGTPSKCAVYSWDNSAIISSKASEGRSDAHDRESTQNIINKFKKDKDKTTKDRKTEITEGCGILGEEAGDMLKDALKYLIIAGVILVIVLTLVDFIKAIAGAIDKGFKKSWKRFIRRIISLALLFLLPAIITFVLTEIDIDGVNQDSIFCGIEK